MNNQQTDTSYINQSKKPLAEPKYAEREKGNLDQIKDGDRGGGGPPKLFRQNRSENTKNDEVTAAAKQREIKVREAKMQLNKLSRDNFNKVVPYVKDICLSCIDMCNQICNVVIEKACADAKYTILFSNLYAYLIKEKEIGQFANQHTINKEQPLEQSNNFIRYFVLDYIFGVLEGKIEIFPSKRPFDTLNAEDRQQHLKQRRKNYILLMLFASQLYILHQIPLNIIQCISCLLLYNFTAIYQEKFRLVISAAAKKCQIKTNHIQNSDSRPVTAQTINVSTITETTSLASVDSEVNALNEQKDFIYNEEVNLEALIAMLDYLGKYLYVQQLQKNKSMFSEEYDKSVANKFKKEAISLNFTQTNQYEFLSMQGLCLIFQIIKQQLQVSKKIQFALQNIVDKITNCWQDTQQQDGDNLSRYIGSSI